MAHDFVKFPELTDSQMAVYYFESPHKQIFNDFRAVVVKVHDGDTITLRWKERNFDFPLRFINIAAPELKQDGGKESQAWLEKMLIGNEIGIIINPDNRVDKWGRLLGYVNLHGTDVGEESIMLNKSKPWSEREDGIIPDFDMELDKIWA